MNYRNQEDDILGRALNSVSVLNVAQSLGHNLRLGANHSPFREDKKPSFAVLHDGSSFKDFSTGDKGGCWNYLRLAKPDWPNAEIARHLIHLAGLSDNRSTKRPNKTQLRETNRRRRKAAFKKLKQGFDLKQIEDTPKWSKEISGYYREGNRFLENSPSTIAKLCESRAWPSSWGELLAEVGKWAYVKEPWSDKRQVAFLVEKPILSEDGRHCDMIPVGYHQRFYNINGGKQWVFVPYIPTEDKASGDFRTTLTQQRTRCRPYPFVVGKLCEPSIVVILEGQWDAITFWGAAGFFDEAPLCDKVCCFGLRGVESANNYLFKYGPWLKANNPKVLCIADNDTAGEAFHKDIKRDDGTVAPSLSNRIQHLGVDHVVGTNCDSVKDFNDAYRASPQFWGPNQIRELLIDFQLIS